MDQLRRVAANESRFRAKVAGETTIDGTLHDAQRAQEHVADLADRTTLIFRLGLQRNLRQRQPAGFSVSNRGSE
jgi:hypothetical protein